MKNAQNTVRIIRFCLYYPVQFAPRLMPAGFFVRHFCRFIVWLDKPLRQFLVRGGK